MKKKTTDVLNYLKRKQVKIAPVSVRDIMKDLDLSSESVVFYHLNKLQAAGLIERPKGLARQIRVIGKVTKSKL